MGGRLYIGVYNIIHMGVVGLGCLGVPCSPRDPRFAGSNPAEDDGFLSRRKSLERKSSGRDFNLGAPSMSFQAR